MLFNMLGIGQYKMLSKLLFHKNNYNNFDIIKKYEFIIATITISCYTNLPLCLASSGGNAVFICFCCLFDAANELPGHLMSRMFKFYNQANDEIKIAYISTSVSYTHLTLPTKA